MKITVWSALSGKVSGHLVMDVPGTHTVRKLLDTYCRHKGVLSESYVMRSRDNLLLNPNKTLEQSNVKDGETLTLGLSDDEEQTFAFVSWWLVITVAFLMGSLGLSITIWTFLKPIPSTVKYGIVMDAGSSHSEIYVYSWNGEKLLGTAELRLLHTCFMTGGISSFAEHVDDLGGYLEKCIGEAKDYVPLNYRPGTPFYVGATAGMRILRDFNPDTASLILATLREILRTTTTFLVIHKNIDIIEGSEEGVSGWTAVNYLMGHFTKDKNHTAAALDVGGASMQISRVVDDNGTWPAENVTLFRRIYPVLSQSFLCYGIGEAQHRYDYLLINENNTLKPEVYVDPCLAEGITHNITDSDLSGPCTRTDDSKPILTGRSSEKWHKIKKLKNYISNKDESPKDKKAVFSDTTTEVKPVNNSETLNTFFTSGSSNASMCHLKMKRLFDLKLCKQTFTYGDCMNADSIPAINSDLVAFSGLFEQMLKLLDLQPGTSLLELKDVIFEVCSLNAQDLYKRFPELPKVLVEDICFDSMYIYNLMTDGLGIDSEEWKKVQFTDEINSTEIEWPMGFMMNRTSSFPADVPASGISLTVFILLLCLFAAFLISGVLFSWHSVKIKQRSTSYQRCGPHQA